MHRIDALSCTRIGIDHVVRDRERAGDLERVRAAVARPVARHERLAVVARAATTVNGPYPKLLATPTSIATTQTEGSFASTRAGSPGVRKKPFLTLNVNVFVSSLKNRMPAGCAHRSVPKVAKPGSTPGYARWNWKLPEGTTSPSLPGPTICAHSYERR